MDKTNNFLKHTSNNPLQKLLLGNFFKTLISILKPLEIKSVLDAGCGEGFTLNQLWQNHIGSYLEGLEYSQDAITLGKKHHPHITFKQGTIYGMPYKNNSFDLVICTEVLEHLEDPKKALKELLRVSRKYLLLSVPNEPWFIMANFLRGKNWSRRGNDIEHINHWSSRGFEEFIKQEKVTIITKAHPFPWTTLVLEKHPQ